LAVAAHDYNVHYALRSTHPLYALVQAQAKAAALPAFTIALVACIWLMSLPAMSSARASLGTARTAISAIPAAALLLLMGGAVAATQASLDDLSTLGRGGAISALPPSQLQAIPAARDRDGAPMPPPPIQGDCLVSEAPTGWYLQSLFRDDTSICPSERQAMEEPLSQDTSPIIAIASGRAAAALTHEPWFGESGTINVLLQPDALEAIEGDYVAALQVGGVSLLWELPPPPPVAEEPTPGVWNNQVAQDLPVTVMEGPYTILVAGGIHSRLPAGTMGTDTLHLALQMRDPGDRKLVLIPRKTWSVQDLVSLCLSVKDVPGAVCAIRPETPIRWSLRTGLPLPW